MTRGESTTPSRTGGRATSRSPSAGSFTSATLRRRSPKRPRRRTERGSKPSRPRSLDSWSSRRLPRELVKARAHHRPIRERERPGRRTARHHRSGLRRQRPARPRPLVDSRAAIELMVGPEVALGALSAWCPRTPSSHTSPLSPSCLLCSTRQVPRVSARSHPTIDIVRFSQ